MPTAKIGDVRSIMRSRDKVSRYYSRRRRGGLAIPGKSAWCRFLSKRFRTIIFDCRGTGHSSKPDHGYTIEQFAKDCAGLLEHLKIRALPRGGFCAGRADRSGASDSSGLIGRDFDDCRRRRRNESDGRRAARGAQHRRRGDSRARLRAFIRGHIENTHMAFNAKFFATIRKWSRRFPTRCGNGKRAPSSIAIISTRGAPGIPSAMRRRSRCRR